MPTFRWIQFLFSLSGICSHYQGLILCWYYPDFDAPYCIVLFILWILRRACGETGRIKESEILQGCFSWFYAKLCKSGLAGYFVSLDTYICSFEVAEDQWHHKTCFILFLLLTHLKAKMATGESQCSHVIILQLLLRGKVRLYFTSPPGCSYSKSMLMTKRPVKGEKKKPASVFWEVPCSSWEAICIAKMIATWSMMRSFTLPKAWKAILPTASKPFPSFRSKTSGGLLWSLCNLN